ncbi:MAG: hypothetical protein V7606_707 [Burkholderiales bacterium]
MSEGVAQPREPVECQARAAVLGGPKAKARNKFPGLPEGFEPEGRIAALRRLLRGPP